MIGTAWRCVAVLLIVVWPIGARGAEDPAGVALFEAKIRPVLIRECYPCHASGAKSIKGGLRLDSREGLRAGGESGQILIPGKPDESPILEALRHEGLAMPPRGKLPDAVIADFTHWIKLGAPDPRDGAAPARPSPAANDIEAGRRFWAYQAPRTSLPPEVRDASWPSTEIDRFILAGLEAKGLRPVADADRHTLARRLAYDLIGLLLPPEEVDAFVADPAPDAYERLVDRLLASPAFGERWGRHWLDVARFAESLTLRGFIFPNAWRYRDFVIEAFNSDMPFDRFVLEQIAGDLVAAGSPRDRRRQVTATTFLMLGNANLEEQDKRQLDMDLVDEQLDTIGKAILGQTIGCARCHDHKFDPIPTRDYYALAGILASTRALEHANVSKWLEVPLPVPEREEAALRRQEEAVAALEARIKAEKSGRSQVGPSAGGPLPVASAPGIVVDDAKARRVGDWTTSRFSRTYIGAGYLHDGDAGKGEKTLTFQPELPEAGPYDVWLAYSPGSSRSSEVPVTVLSADGETTVRVDMRATPPIDGRYVSLGRFRFEKNGQGFVMIANEGTTGHVTADAVCFVPARMVVPSGPGKAVADSASPSPEIELKRLKAAGPRRPMAMTVLERPKPGDTQVHIRGSVHTLGDHVPRGFLRVATLGPAPAIPSDQSGRRELAEWLGSGRNPLTARVFANRAWHWLFGAGLVRTTDNFGTTGEPPSHPELLGDLAARFAGEDGWSVKRLVRRIVLSRTYRLASAADADPKAALADPENRLLRRQNRRRLDAECIRDAILSAGGALRRDMGGPGFPADLPADYDYRDSQTRRSVYVPVFRNALPELFEVFDFADPSMVVGRRDASTVAPQALFLMNHPFVLDQARRASRRLLAGPDRDDPARGARAYRWTLGRAPTPAERELAVRFVAGEPGMRAEDAWALVFQALFSSVDFRYVN
ncbi:MAG: DUF1553 domain-containing protein [Isosphaeraceae bacterium]